jgi:hypothetical protein
LSAVPKGAKWYRNRAIDCRALAKSARSEVDAAMLEKLADERQAEARLIDRKNAAQQNRQQA